MSLRSSAERLPLSSILINREGRQRRELDTSDLEESIRLRGVLVPLIVRRPQIGEVNPVGEVPESSFVLVAGERRLEASRKLGLPDVPIIWLENLSPLEAQIVELEENIKRK